MLSLDNKDWNCAGCKALVWMSASCDEVEIGRSLITPAWTLSLMRWQSISMCFVLSCMAGFCAIRIADWLSQNRGTGCGRGCFKSWSKYKSHWISHVVEAKALYYALVDDLDIVPCFFDFQLIKDAP